MITCVQLFNAGVSDIQEHVQFLHFVNVTVAFWVRTSTKVNDTDNK